MTSARVIHPRARDVALVIALVVAAVAYAAWVQSGRPDFRADFDYVYEGARAMRRGESPWAAVGPGRAFDIPWELYYPLPAMVVVAPLTLAPLPLARLLFVSVSAGVLAAAILRSGYRWRLVAFASQGALSTFALGQWSALMLALAMWPALGWLALAKPNIGVAMLAGHRPRALLRGAVPGAVLLLAVCFVARPAWVQEWLPTLSGFGHGSIPLTRPFGFLLLLAALRWRRPDARILLLLSCVPQTPHLYDGLLFFAFARTRLECVALAVLTYVSVYAWQQLGPYPDFHADAVAYGRVMIWCLFLPSLLMILRRPNEDDATTREAVAHA